MSTAIDQAVMAKLRGDTSLASLAPGGIYPDVAPKGAADAGVFVVVGMQAHEDVAQLQGQTAYETPRYLVKAVGQGIDGAAAIAAYDRIHVLLQHQALTVTGFHWMDTVRESRVRYVEQDGPISWQHVGGVYRVEADPS